MSHFIIHKPKVLVGQSFQFLTQLLHKFSKYYIFSQSVTSCACGGGARGGSPTRRGRAAARAPR